MRIAIAIAILPWVLAAQEKPDAKAEALKQLEAASGFLAAKNDPVLDIVARYHLARAWLAAGDRKRAQEHLDFAFTALSPDLGAVEARHQFLQFQGDVVSFAVSLDPERAQSMITAMPKPASGEFDMRTSPASALIGYYRQSQPAKAVELAQQFCTEGICPYGAVRGLIKQLPPDDERRIPLYYATLQAYRANQGPFFTDYFNQVWTEVPKDAAAQGLDAVLSVILNQKDDSNSGFQQVWSSPAGTAILSSRADADLFKLIPALRVLEPKKLDELLDQRTGLKSAVGQFPDGLDTLSKSGSVNYSVGGGGAAAVAREASHSVAAKALADAETNPDRALDAAASIPDPADRIRVLSAVARQTKSSRLLGRCLEIAKDLPASSDVVDALVGIAKIAKQIEDEDVIHAALARALSSARELHRTDTDPDHPNLALIEYWPSTQAHRLVAVNAVTLEGTSGLAFLDAVRDSGMAALARIAAAETLLGKPPSNGVTYTTYRK
jgi:hypothetical protein